jgi:diaminopimelate decarboxylase
MKQHYPLYQFPVVNDELILGGMPISHLAEWIGQTPFYAYDRAAICQRVQTLRAQLPKQVALHYAIKANPLPDIVNLLAEQVTGFDIASGGELALALATGMPPEQISFAGPAKTNTELSAAIQAGVILHVESANELTRIYKLSESIGKQPQVALRVNPAFVLKSSGMQMGGGPQPFGIDEEQIPAVITQMAEYDIPLLGLHIYCGSQNLHAEAIIAAQQASFELAYRLAEQYSEELRLLNIGGGFGIPYFPGQQPLQIEPIATALQQRVEECYARLGSIQIILELGRYLVGEAGVYVSEVIDRKVSQGRHYVLTNGGLHHHLAASGNFGQVIRKNYPVVHAQKVFGGEREQVNVVGPLCTPLDIVADELTLGKAVPGDLIAVLQSGAYGSSASPQQFLSHPPVLEKLV